ncbi:hypothetical protein I5907_20585 [Panacibacter sp. DH6]|uniref:Carboxyltransferase domain-containing protein n=1 Tax=Panacibacter microcysteis TaxID=2793269 RepID=A0A931H089_9BACT|nr:hypothetical protein [Panacibacter microcysteis]
MSIRMLKSGLFDTVQDMGRYGYQHLGVNPGGVMDPAAASIANILVGKNMHTPVIEMHFPAASFLFEEDCLVALSGGDFGAHINEQPVPLNTAILAGRQSVLTFRNYRSGARVYLSVQGKLNADAWLGSYSTNTALAVGGYNGRRLQKNDVLVLRGERTMATAMEPSAVIIIPITIDTAEFYASDNKICCLQGKDFYALGDASKEALMHNGFTITRQSDRMGYRLQGNLPAHTTQATTISSGVTK